MAETITKSTNNIRSDLLRLLGALSSPEKALSREAQGQLKNRLGELEDLVAADEIEGLQLKQLTLLGSAAIPYVVSMLAKLGPNERDRTRWLVEVLEEIAAPAPELLRPYQKELGEIVLAIDEEGYTFYSDTATSFGNCLGGIGESADEFIATSIEAHIQELNKQRDPYDMSNLRLVALVKAAEVCAGPKSREAVKGLRFNTKGAGLALRALFRLGETDVMQKLTSKVILEKASGALLQTLRELMLLPEKKAEPFARAGKDQLKKLVENTSLHGDIRGTALSILFRFFYSETIKLAVKISGKEPKSETGWTLLLHLVRAAFASDGLQEEVQVKEGGYRLFSPGHGRHDDAVSGVVGAQVRVKAQVVYKGKGSELTQDHVTIARNVLSYGVTRSAAFVMGVLGDGIALLLDDPLCVDMLTRQSDSTWVYYRPISILDTPAETISELADIALEFTENEKNKWRNHWSLGVCGSPAENGAMHAIRFLRRIRDAKRLASLAGNDKVPNVQGCALRLCGSLAGELKGEYAKALKADKHHALFGLIVAARTTPEAASLLRSYGRKLLLYRTSIASPASATEDPFAALAQISPALAAEFYQDYVRGESGMSLDFVVGRKGEKLEAIRALRKMQESIPAS